MKPLKLTLTAFGPYKGTEVVDFTKIKDTLYRITGETGSGKTTIFDAICFALFEETSNKPSNAKKNPVAQGSVRDKTMLHSTLAPMSTDTVVELYFEDGGKEYRVKRSIHYPKHRDGSGYDDPSFDAELLGNGLVVTNSNNVTKEIERIVGMNSTQFRQIVMLAQGEFKAFMNSKDDERKTILSNLFGGESYARFMYLLGESHKDMKKKLDAEKAKIDIYLSPVSFPLPEDMDAAEKALYSPSHPQLSENICNLIASETKQVEKLKTEEETADSELSKQKEQLSRAETNNEKLSHLKELEKEREELAEKTPIMDERKLSLERAERAFRRVRPSEVKKQNCEDDHKKAADALSDAETALANSETAYEEAEAALAALEPRQTVLEAWHQERKTISDSLQEYDRLDEANRAFKDAEAKIKSLNSELEGLGKQELKDNSELVAVREELARLENVQTELAEAKTAVERLTEHGDKLAGLERDVKALRKLESEAEKCLKDYNQKFENCKTLQTSADELRSHFLRHQAAALSVELRQAIEEKGEGICPVCGARHKRDSLAVLPEANAETVSEDAVNAAQKDADAAAEKRNDAENAYTASKTKLGSAEESACKLADELIPACAPWTIELLRDGKTLSAQLTLHAQALECANKKQETARKQTERKAELSGQEKELSDKLEGYGNKKDELNRKLSDASAELTKQKTTVEELTRKLSFADKKSAERELKELNSSISSLEKEIKTAEERKTEAGKDLASAVTRKEERTRALEEAVNKLEQAVADYITARKSNGFDAESYHAALPPVSDGEKWLTDEKEALDGYYNSVKVNQHKLDAQKDLCEGLQFTDTEELNKRIEALEEELKKMKVKSGNVRQNLQYHETALKNVEASLQKQQKLQAAFDRLKVLSDAANGSSTASSGKHAFDGYVLSRTFREVLKHASMHLSAMTNGRYELQHESEGKRANSAADFRILVLDRSDGSKREVGSISGGESFQASMALALGLSDVAQNHAMGGKRIEAMFVDEGFGSLDEQSLDSMLNTLRNISNNKRTVGLISHVNELQNYTRDEIAVVRSGENQGSHIIQR